MKITKDLYQSNLALLTDFYQLTMAYAYWKSGKGEQEADSICFSERTRLRGASPWPRAWTMWWITAKTYSLSKGSWTTCGR